MKIAILVSICLLFICGCDKEDGYIYYYPTKDNQIVLPADLILELAPLTKEESKTMAHADKLIIPKGTKIYFDKE